MENKKQEKSGFAIFMSKVGNACKTAWDKTKAFFKGPMAQKVPALYAWLSIGVVSVALLVVYIVLACQ